VVATLQNKLSNTETWQNVYHQKNNISIKILIMLYGRKNYKAKLRWVK